MPLVPILADVDDINTHLPTDKLDASNELATAAINLIEIDVARLIKGSLSGVYQPVTLAAWVDPTSTPEYIRAIAGRLIAAFYYAQRYSEDLAVESGFSQGLYNEAICMLEQVRSGEIVLPISEAPVQNTLFSEAFFSPNSNSTPPKFSMDNVFG